MLTTDVQGDEDGTIVRSFFELNVSSVEIGFNQLTIEVQKAISKYPKFNFFHVLRLFEDDAHYYLKNREKLSLAEKTDMIRRGEETESKTIHIYELFSDGSWHISDSDPYVCDSDTEYGWIQPE